MGWLVFFSMKMHSAIRQPKTKKPPGAWFMMPSRSTDSGMIGMPIQEPLPRISRTEDMHSMVRI